MKRFTTALIAAATALSLVALNAPRAAAHDVLLNTDPAHNQVLSTAPDTITLTYNNEIIALAGANLVEVRDASDNTLTTTEPQINGTSVTQKVPQLAADRVYRVVWRVVSSDGHPIEGSFNFGVGAVGETELAELPAAINAAANALPLSPELAAKQQHITVTTPSDRAAQTDAAQNSAASNSAAKSIFDSPLPLVAGAASVLLFVLVLLRLGRQKTHK